MTYLMPLPYNKPPLNMNDGGITRAAKFARAATIKELRTTAARLARALRLPLDNPHATVQLHYRPVDNRRRDTDNLTATAKPLYDGLTDYGLVKDDIPQHMSKPEPVIHRKGKPALWLTITLHDTPKELPE